MSLTVFAVVLFAALLHAGWNAIVKGAGDKLLTTVLVAGCGAGVSAIALPFLTQPAPESWPYLGVSAVLQIGYYLLVANAYRVGDMSRVYPIMRGTAPLIVVVISAVLLNEVVPLPGWAGIALISAGIMSLAFVGIPGTPRAAGTGFALANAVVIAGYTLIDGAGVRVSGSAVAYTLWLYVLTGVPLVVWALIARRTAFVTLARTEFHLGLIGGLATLISYGLALWAMTLAPIPLVAALRETSILWGTAIVGLVLRERDRPGPARRGRARRPRRDNPPVSVIVTRPGYSSCQRIFAAIPTQSPAMNKKTLAFLAAALLSFPAVPSMTGDPTTRWTVVEAGRTGQCCCSPGARTPDCRSAPRGPSAAVGVQRTRSYLKLE